MALSSPAPVSLAVAIADPSGVGEARRTARDEALRAGFSEHDVSRLALIATEIATNISRHTRGGNLLIQSVQLPTGQAIDLFGIDLGPGMENPEICVRDGYSTANTPGIGLGAIIRQADVLDLYSTVKTGTVIFARVEAQSPAKASRQDPFAYAALRIPHPAETICGDTWRIHGHADGFSILIADGLGHGPAAAEAAERAGVVFDLAPVQPPALAMRKMHESLRGSRGGAAAYASFSYTENQLSYCGIGNIAGRIASRGNTRGLLSLNGTVGVQAGQIRSYVYEWSNDSVLIMHSDGLQTRWEAQSYPGLWLRHPGVIVGTLYRDFNRKRDDVSIVAATWSSQNALRVTHG